MLRIALSLRYVMLIASAGAALGALVMFWEGSAHMLGATISIFTGIELQADHRAGDGRHGRAPVRRRSRHLRLQPSPSASCSSCRRSGSANCSPPGCAQTGVSELKATLVGVILVYLVVDFATEWAANTAESTWLVLTKPISILLIALLCACSRTSRKTDVSSRFPDKAIDRSTGSDPTSSRVRRSSARRRGRGGRSL